MKYLWTRAWEGSGCPCTNVRWLSRRFVSYSSLFYLYYKYWVFQYGRHSRKPRYPCFIVMVSPKEPCLASQWFKSNWDSLFQNFCTFLSGTYSAPLPTLLPTLHLFEKSIVKKKCSFVSTVRAPWIWRTYVPSVPTFDFLSNIPISIDKRRYVNSKNYLRKLLSHR